MRLWKCPTPRQLIGHRLPLASDAGSQQPGPAGHHADSCLASAPSCAYGHLGGLSRPCSPHLHPAALLPANTRLTPGGSLLGPGQPWCVLWPGRREARGGAWCCLCRWPLDRRHMTHTLIPALPLVHAELGKSSPHWASVSHLQNTEKPTRRQGCVGAGRRWEGRPREGPSLLGLASLLRLPGSSFHTPTCSGQVDWAPVPHQPPGPGLQFPAQFVGCRWISAWDAQNSDCTSGSPSLLPSLCWAGGPPGSSPRLPAPHPFLLWSLGPGGLPSSGGSHPVCTLISLSPGLCHRLPGDFCVSPPFL